MLGLFDETAVLRGDDQRELTEGGGNSEPPAQLSCKGNVATEFRIKGDDSRKVWVLAKYGQINPTRMIKYVLASKVVSDDVKIGLCAGRKAKECVDWKAAFDEAQKTRLRKAEGSAALAHAELASLTPAERKSRERQHVLDERTVHRLSAAQVSAVHFALCTFFFICRIPFLTIEHWAFVAFVKALNPAYTAHLFKRTALSTTWLSTLKGETEEKTEAFLGKCMGRKTIIIDGFKDRRGRHVMNMSDAKVGFASYAKTSWFGRRNHGGQTYFEEVERHVGDGNEYIACCADNTSSNTSMQKGLFGLLNKKFNCFFGGCCVHCLDLLSEDIAKLDEISTVIDEFKLVTGIVLRFSLLTETFIALQQQRHKADKSASLLMLKTFPDTRFAYAFFVVFAVLENWSVLQSLIDSPEYKVLKASAKPPRRQKLRQFESIVNDSNKKAAGMAAVAVMRPISTALHYLEGTDVDSSHVLPVYNMLHQNAQNPSEDAKDAFEAETISAMTSLLKDRWNGAGRKVGIRNDLHCLAWKLDLHVRSIITHGFSNGPELVTAIDSSFGLSAVMGALKTYSAKDDGVSMLNVAEYESFTSKTGIWELKHSSADMLVKTKIAAIIAKMSDEVKKNPVSRLVELLKCKDLTLARQMHKSMSEDSTSPHALRLFTAMAVGESQLVLSHVTYLCYLQSVFSLFVAQ